MICVLLKKLKKVKTLYKKIKFFCCKILPAFDNLNENRFLFLNLLLIIVYYYSIMACLKPLKIPNIHPSGNPVRTQSNAVRINERLMRIV